MNTFQNDFSRDVLVTKAKEKIDGLLKSLAGRKTRNKENMDFSVVTDWLLQVRGLKSV
jgi:hypothetical protein